LWAKRLNLNPSDIEIDWVIAKPSNNYSVFNHAAMTVKSKRFVLILGDITDTFTAEVKAKDLDSTALLRSSFDTVESGVEIFLGVKIAKQKGGFDGSS